MTVTAAPPTPPTPLGQPAVPNPVDMRKRLDRILAPLQSHPEVSVITLAAGQLIVELGRLTPDAQRTMVFHVLSEVAKGTPEHAKRLAEENRRLKDPPHRVGVLEEVCSDAAGRPVATVGTRDGLLEVQISTDVKADELRPGQRVILAPNGTVIDGRTAAPANPLCEFDTLLPDGRVLARLEGGQRLVLLPGWDLQTPESLQHLKPGDMIEYEPVTQHALRLTQRSARIQEFIGEIPDVWREDVGGIDEIWPEIQEKVLAPILHPEVHAKYGVGTPRGILFSGAPGVGKTLLIKAAARAVLSAIGARSDAPVIFAIPGASLLRPYVGEGNCLLRAVAAAAEKAAAEHGFAVILLDDFEYAGGLHRGLGDRSTPAYSSLTQALLAEMDGLGSRKGRVTWMATTNRPDLLDSALCRPGRFSSRISVPRPGPEGCRQIARVHLRGKPLDRNLSVEGLADAVVERIFDATDAGLLLRIHYSDAGEEEVFGPRVISGAIIAAAVADAAHRAITREVAGQPGGLRREELLACLDHHLRTSVTYVTPSNIRQYYLNLPEDRPVASVEQVQPPSQGPRESFVA